MDWKSWKDKMPWLTRAIFLLFIGAFLMILSSSFSSDKEEVQKEPIPEVAPSTDTLNSMQHEIEARLASTLSEIEGVGDVTVTVFLASGPRFNYAVNTSATDRAIDERDKSGGNRTTTERNTDDQLVLLREGSGSTEKPVLLSEDQAQVQGVLIVADGASSSFVKRQVTLMVATLLDIPEYKVTVEPRKGGISLGSDER